MKKALYLLIPAIILVSWNSHTQTKSVAVIPFDVSYEGKGFDTTVAETADEEQETGQDYQYDLYRWLKAHQDDYPVTFQDADSTDSLLSRQNIGYKEIFQRDKSDLCKVLGVDEIVAGKVVLSQPWSLASIRDYKEIRDYKVKATLNIYDSQNTLLWSFKNTVRDTISQSSITEKLMRRYEKKIVF